MTAARPTPYGRAKQELGRHSQEGFSHLAPDDILRAQEEDFGFFYSNGPQSKWLNLCPTESRQIDPPELFVAYP